ncbi:MAG: hypothetical protein DMG08_05310 [Acidobacteria bacterium]|nr:MAG: hypothetical protein DMG08_05310 [Acidobacteriota bacterium]PYV02704.1 MAG: hypothetical protein DMG10_13770 [Acidobacteriota bacterium]
MPGRRPNTAGRLSLRFATFALLLQAMLLLSAEKDIGKLNLQGQTTKEVTITGEIVDVSCYVKMGALGMDHKECALGCAKAGMPLALLEDKTSKVYLLVSDKEFESVNVKLQPLEKSVAQKSIAIRGRTYEKGGQLILEVLSVGKGK